MSQLFTKCNSNLISPINCNSNQNRSNDNNSSIVYNWKTTPLSFKTNFIIYSDLISVLFKYQYMGVGRCGQGGRGSPEFPHRIPLMCLSTNARFVNASQLSPTIWLADVAAGVIKTNWRPGYKVFFSHESGNFLKSIGIFPKMGILRKKVFQLLREALDSAFPLGKPWMHAHCAA